MRRDDDELLSLAWALCERELRERDLRERELRECDLRERVCECEWVWVCDGVLTCGGDDAVDDEEARRGACAGVSGVAVSSGTGRCGGVVGLSVEVRTASMPGDVSSSNDQSAAPALGEATSATWAGEWLYCLLSPSCTGLTAPSLF